MHLVTLPLEQTVGHILRHNISDAHGHKAFSKGRRLRENDLPQLRELGISELRVAMLEPGDVHEDAAAGRVAASVCGQGVVATIPTHSRVNLLAEANGVLRVAIDQLQAINAIEGVTLATLPTHRYVIARQRVATIKIIPFAIPETQLVQAEKLAHSVAGVVALSPVRSLAVGVIIIGSESARERLLQGVYPAIEARIQHYGSHVLAVRYVAPEETLVAATLRQLQADGAGLLICAGETSIMDRDDVTPSAIRLAGGWIEQYGAPVEPGNLLLLGYLDQPDPLPVLGAPGCVRSRDTNIVDLLLPRLLAGEQITRHAIIMLGHGGLLG